MNIAEEIRKKIRQELESGATQKELAKKYGMTQGNVSRILSGTHSVSFDVIERMFPRLQLSLDGDKTSPPPSPAARQSVHSIRRETRETVQKEIVRRVKVSPHLDTATKQIVLAIINGTPPPAAAVAPAQTAPRSYGGIAISARPGVMVRRNGFTSRAGRLKRGIKNPRGGNFGSM